MRTCLAAVLALAFTLLCAPARAEMLGMNIAVSTLALSSSTQQGGTGPQGSTILTQTDMVYTPDWYGIGMFMLYDFQGSSQKDLSFGPKLEIALGSFFLEGGFAFVVRRDFTDRSIAFQSGNGWFAGIGIRFGLEAPDSGWFFQASYKIRVQNLTQQDSTTLTDSIRIQDGYPLVGLGLNF